MHMSIHTHHALRGISDRELKALPQCNLLATTAPWGISNRELKVIKKLKSITGKPLVPHLK